jgi:hypothetical protein
VGGAETVPLCRTGAYAGHQLGGEHTGDDHHQQPVGIKADTGRAGGSGRATGCAAAARPDSTDQRTLLR